ncbi:hypothetical protein LTR99_010775 [Exophiala xenobiotica]|uniref:Transcription factor domain-containing protein n=1 Tax=Vermiconidia calcicola TaxID=1690605 RepID=A0AAV9PVK0_9PEZI|nr:hypothetical protein LTR92_004955 [Exophiala xenobiotica]KAK5527912.1 hypothetical protein LTR25_010843 [Vermiconidia calcicola]KAK5538180.1 hypothetical protein LTR23_007144 [Chaetothyriales sp. CCFEE 6169]KAK5209143.1 hypothetical protein LTR41_005542 [Exophiala xenobiotica]KAK5216137.1 hypothetical protein LTR72_010876 [Exophiala xenobiotica]
MVPDMVHDDSVRMLCVETLTIVQRYGLFRAYENLDIKQDTFGNSTDDTMDWQAWARVESTKRLIICLIMVDAFYAHKYGMRPVVRSDLAQFILPCPSSLFEAPTASRWKALRTVENKPLSSRVVLHRDAISLPQTENFGMHGLLSLIWAKVLDAEYLLITSASASHHPYFTAPGEVFAEHDARDIAPLVQEIYEVYENTLATMNPNCLVSWNDTCLKLTSNYRVFESAAGCQGAEQAQIALDHVARWSRTVSARRACLHAAQIYLIMSRRKTSDRIMFHSELAIFASALVLGFYLYALPKPLVVVNERDDFELLEDVDWTEMGLVGMGGSVATISGAHTPKNAAKAFVEEGGNLSFDGLKLPGGLKSAQHIFWEFSSLLEDVGKWNVQKQCKVLRVLSDMSMEPAKFGMDDFQI